MFGTEISRIVIDLVACAIWKLNATAACWPRKIRVGAAVEVLHGATDYSGVRVSVWVSSTRNYRAGYVSDRSSRSAEDRETRTSNVKPTLKSGSSVIHSRNSLLRPSVWLKRKQHLHDHRRMTFSPNDTCTNHDGNGVDTFLFFDQHLRKSSVIRVYKKQSKNKNTECRRNRCTVSSSWSVRGVTRFSVTEELYSRTRSKDRENVTRVKFSGVND